MVNGLGMRLDSRGIHRKSDYLLSTYFICYRYSFRRCCWKYGKKCAISHDSYLAHAMIDLFLECLHVECCT